MLIKMVRETVKDEPVIALIRKFLKSGVMIDGLVSQTEQETPQGGNLSPLLSNILDFTPMGGRRQGKPLRSTSGGKAKA